MDEIEKIREQEDAGLTWEAVEIEHLVQDEWIDFRKVRYRFPDGTEFEPFYNYSRRDYVVILATDEEGKILCVRQYRHGIGEVTTEFVAGGLECINKDQQAAGEDKYASADRKSVTKFVAGAPGNVYEDALEGAKRELLEETGYVSEEWEQLIKIPSNATIADNYAYIFFARNCKKISGQKLDDTEFLNVVRLSEEELEGLIKAGKFQQSVHVMAWYMAKDRAGK